MVKDPAEQLRQQRALLCGESVDEPALTGADVAEKFKTFGDEQCPTTRAQFSQFVKDESQRFGDVIKKANVSLD